MVQSVGDSFKDQFARHYKDAAEKIGRFNLAIFGKTGAGKARLSTRSLVRLLPRQELASRSSR